MARHLGVLAAILLVPACTTVAPVSETSLGSRSDAVGIAENLEITYRVLATKGDGECPLAGAQVSTEAPCYEAEVALASKVPLDLSGSAIYFSQVEPVAHVPAAGPAAIDHINGDLHRLSLADGAGDVGPGVTRRIGFTVAGSALTRSKFMPNYYVVDALGNAQIIASTREAALDAMGRDALPFLAPLPGSLQRAARDLTPIETPEVTFAIDAGTKFLAEALDTGIIPRPLHVSRRDDQARVDLSRGLAPRLRGVTQAEIEAGFDRLAVLGVPREEDGLPIEITVDESLAIPEEGYEMTLHPEGIVARASDGAGAFYALQSLAALVSPGSAAVPALDIEDEPRFGFRGMHVDIARNFHGVETLRALIDQMAAYKLNKLHLHLADDEGWRLEIAGLPELTAIGSQRCHDPSETRCLLPQLGSGPDTTTSGSGYLSEADYTGLLRYAAARHIEVIPALDMPGHARAAVKAMEARYARLKSEGADEETAARFLLSDPDDATEYSSIQHYSDNTINVCRPSAYRFIGHVLDRISALHEAAGAPLKRYHIGADETAGAWAKSPLCSEFLESGEGPASVEGLGGYFVARVARMVAERGILPAAWSDGISHAEDQDLPPRLQSNVWDTLAWGANATSNRHANRGWDVVISIPDATYFDLPYAAHPEEGGYYWAIRRAPTRKLFSMMPENLPALAAYWQDRDGQPFVIDDRPGGGAKAHRPLAPGTRFAGLQGHIWTETVRDRETFGYQVFPRLLALAERAWSRAEWEVPYDHSGLLVASGRALVDTGRKAAIDSDWSRFASILARKELPKVESAGWSYRLPVPGARIVEGRLEVSTAIPGLPIECDQGTGWLPLEECDLANGRSLRLRTTSPGGLRYGRAVEVAPR